MKASQIAKLLEDKDSDATPGQIAIRALVLANTVADLDALAEPAQLYAAEVAADLMLQAKVDQSQAALMEMTELRLEIQATDEPDWEDLAQRLLELFEKVLKTDLAFKQVLYPKWGS